MTSSDALKRSAGTVENPFNSTDDVVAWIERRNSEVRVSVREVPFDGLSGWHFDKDTGNLVHDSGRFFSIVGIDVLKHTASVQRWRQPIISQPEVGYLGILCKEFDGVMYFLLQAKIEPGNVNCVQLSPTLQATRSNYTCVHGGKVPAYLDYFKSASSDHIVLDQLQSEQGARFLRKRNRNMIVRVDDDVEIGEDFRWLTLGQIKQLMRRDNTVNMDTRTVLSGLRIHDVDAESERAMHSVDEVLHQLSELKSRYELIAEKIPLNEVSDWIVTDSEIVRPDRLFFRVLGVDVSISNREVSRWCQPIVQPMQEGLSVLFCKKFDGVMHYLMQAKVECGNFDVVELAPTIQCLTGPYKNPIGYTPAFLGDFLSGRCVANILYSAKQSEEGGRFYHEQNMNVVCEVNDLISEDVPENFIWLTMPQIKEFLRFNNYLNIQVRSLISAI